MQKESQRPGSLIIERYMPSATPEEKESAYENLHRLARLIIRVTERLISEEQQQSQDIENQKGRP